MSVKINTMSMMESENNHSEFSQNTRRVGSRKSKLALIQTNEVIDLLKAKDHSKIYEIVSMSTIGDKILEKALSKIGEKSLFTKELELGLSANQFEFVVHSLKDLPTTLPENMVIAAVTKRLNPHDVIIMHKKNSNLKLDQLPPDSVIGTSSVRRSAQLKKNFPHLTFKNIPSLLILKRGNLNTRLSKLDNDDMYDALVLAAAGVCRMGWSDRISQYLTEEECFYAVGQGAIGVECLQDDSETIQYLSELSDEATTLVCIAERAYLRKLEGGCSAPVGIYSEFIDDQLELTGGVFSLDGSEHIIKCASKQITNSNLISNGYRENSELKEFCGIVSKTIDPSKMTAAEEIGLHLAEELLKAGAGKILKEAKAQIQDSINENPNKPSSQVS
ncbi:Porphobilinogen deaminase [Nymphon striatum]|nr:Porphobilinogen deaminase [Nymphon striatum]